MLAGKTGTAQKVVDGTYSDTQYVASFVGFAPADDPQLLVAVIVDDPKGGDYYGGTVAAPAFGEIASFALPYLGIAPDLSPARRPAAARTAACAVPRIAGDEARRAQRRRSARLARERAATRARSPTSPSTAAGRPRDACSSACAG